MAINSLLLLLPRHLLLLTHLPLLQLQILDQTTGAVAAADHDRRGGPVLDLECHPDDFMDSITGTKWSGEFDNAEYWTHGLTR